MKSKFSVLSLLLLILVSSQTLLAAESLDNLVWKAISKNPAESTVALEELRALGPFGLDVLMMRYRDEIQRHVDEPTLKGDDEWQRITKALDVVSGQRNSFLSGLYWHTDLNEAQKVARESGKPILSLRLLGKLTDELSCANSRFFRTVLYSNAEVSAVLRKRFVLHWQSVRPAPVVTIDFGDGRKIERTVTGNSIHYVLDSSGQLLEALPGLYGPQAFLRGLTDAERVFNLVAGKNEQDRINLLSAHYMASHNKLLVSWLNDTAKIGGKVPEGALLTKDQNGQFTAVRVAQLAITKMAAEFNTLRALSSYTERVQKITDEEAWRKIAQLHGSDAVLDERSVGLIRRQYFDLSDEQFSKMLRDFQGLVALDTVRNEYLLRMKHLYPWLIEYRGRMRLEHFTSKVYNDLFLTSGNDPWLGLSDHDVYMGIDNGGVKVPGSLLH